LNGKSISDFFEELKSKVNQCYNVKRETWDVRRCL
jgi:CRISPR-associated protein Cst2